MIKAVIFDIGGVLAYDVWEHLLLDERGGVISIFNLEKERVREVGKTLWKIFAYQKNSIKGNDWRKIERDYWNQFIARLNIKIPEDDFIKLTDIFIRPIEGMTQLLTQLQSRGIELAICSNNTRFWFERQMDKLGLRKFFSPNKVILSYIIGGSKSSPSFEMFEAVLNSLNLDRNQCIFVDDRERNVERGLKYGISSILFPSHSKYGANYLGALLEKMGAL